MKHALSSHLLKFTSDFSKVYQLHFPIPNDIAEQFIDGDHRRIRCLINDKAEIRTGLMPFKTYWYVLCNASLQKDLSLKVGDEVKIVLEKDDSQYGMEMPEELQVLFDQEPEAQNYFDQLSPGKQRNLIYIVSKVKNVDSRLNKALAITAHLKESQGNLNFKRLNELLKYYNNR